MFLKGEWSGVVVIAQSGADARVLGSITIITQFHQAPMGEILNTLVVRRQELLSSSLHFQVLKFFLKTKTLNLTLIQTNENLSNGFKEIFTRLSSSCLCFLVF